MKGEPAVALLHLNYIQILVTLRTHLMANKAAKEENGVDAVHVMGET